MLWNFDNCLVIGKVFKEYNINQEAGKVIMFKWWFVLWILVIFASNDSNLKAQISRHDMMLSRSKILISMAIQMARVIYEYNLKE